jgi:hypothetical protein
MERTHLPRQYRQHALGLGLSSGLHQLEGFSDAIPHQPQTRALEQLIDCVRPIGQARMRRQYGLQGRADLGDDPWVDLA